MESLVSPLVSNLYIMFFHDKALRTSQNPPRFWKRCVNNTFVMQCTECEENILQHINNIDRVTKFTVKDTRPDSLMPSLTLWSYQNIMEHSAPGHTGSLPHTDQYLQ